MASDNNEYHPDSEEEEEIELDDDCFIDPIEEVRRERIRKLEDQILKIRKEIDLWNENKLDYPAKKICGVITNIEETLCILSSYDLPDKEALKNELATNQIILEDYWFQNYQEDKSSELEELSMEKLTPNDSSGSGSETSFEKESSSGVQEVSLSLYNEDELPFSLKLCSLVKLTRKRVYVFDGEQVHCLMKPTRLNYPIDKKQLFLMVTVLGTSFIPLILKQTGTKYYERDVYRIMDSDQSLKEGIKLTCPNKIIKLCRMTPYQVERSLSIRSGVLWFNGSYQEKFVIGNSEREVTIL